MPVFCLSCEIELQDVIGMWTVEGSDATKRSRRLYRFCSKACLDEYVNEKSNERNEVPQSCIGSSTAGIQHANVCTCRNLELINALEDAYQAIHKFRGEIRSQPVNYNMTWEEIDGLTSNMLNFQNKIVNSDAKYTSGTRVNKKRKWTRSAS